jgi:MarR family transcriptional regulator, negative regulator of the multidrug operon emrRAB
VITLTNKMMKAGYLTSKTCEQDSRRRVLGLTQKSIDIMPQLEAIWNAGERGVIEALQNTNAMQVLAILEERFADKGFKDRTLEQLENKN